MADLQTIMQALRNADAAGNTADAQRLAMLAQQYQNTPSADPNTPDTGLMTGITNRALAIGEGLMNLPDTVTEAVTGYKDPRLLVPGDADQFMGVDWRNIGDTKFVENTPDIQKLENPLGFTGDEFENAGKFLQEKREALNYAPKVPWNEVKSNPSPQNVLGFMGEAAITSLPDMAAALISAPAYFASYIAPIAQQRAENDGGRDVTPEDLAYAAVASAGIASAERFGAKGIFGDVYGNVAQRITGAGAREGATEAIQNPLQYAAETVNTQTGFDPIEAVDQAAAGLVGGTGAGVGLRTATEVATGGSMREPEDREAAAALANRLDATAKADSLNPRNVSNRVSTKGARALLDQTHVELSEEIQESYDNLGKAIKKDKTDDAETQRLKRLAKAGLRQAKNKVKNTVGTREMDAVRTLVGNTRDGQQLINLMRESNELTTLHNRGLKGGLSKYTDMVAPLSSGSGYNPRPLIEVPTRAALTGTAAINTGGASLVPQAAIYAGGRLVDMVTGKRSNVANFIKNNKDAANLPAATGINIDENRVNQKEPDEKQKKINRQLFDENAPIVGNPNKPSPQLILHENTGLDRQGIYNTAEEMKADPKYDTIKEELNQVQRSITEGGQIPNINSVAALMAGYLGVKAEQTTRVAPLQQAKIQQGINDNRERIESLRNQAMQDTELNDFDRQLINDALDDLKRDLGTNPVDTAERIVSSAGTLARNKSAVTKYLNPYLDRVRQQQKRKKSEEPTLGDEIREETNAALFDPVDTNEYEGTTYYHGTADIFQEFDLLSRGKNTKANSAKAATWFVDDPRTAESYANYGAEDVPVSRLMQAAETAENDSDFGMSEALMREAEELEQRFAQEGSSGQFVIPVFVPNNLHEIDVEGKSYMDARDTISDALTFAKDQGFDGLKIKNLSDTADYSDYRPATHVAIFDPAKIRSKFAPQQSSNKDQPILSQSPQAEADQFARHVRGRQLRDALDNMLMRAGEGVLKSRKKGDPIGKLGENFDNTKILSRELVKHLDPDGRKTVSMVQVGLNGEGISNEDIQVILPHLIRGMTFLKGSDAMDSDFLGRFRTQTIKGADGKQKVLKRLIDMVDIGEKVGRSGNAEMMTGELFLETMFHEIGHSVEAQSLLRELVGNTKLLASRGDADAKKQIADMIAISAERRKNHWVRLSKQLMEGTMISGQTMPKINDLMTWDFNDWLEFTREGERKIVEQGSYELGGERYRQLVTKNAYKTWEYLSEPAELAADLVAYYFAKPAKLKKNYPTQAKMVRKAVNESGLSEYITFHTIAGLLGAAGITSILLGLGGDDEENQGIFRQMLGQGALNAA